MCMLSHFSHVQLFVTLWTVAKQAFLPLGFSRQGYWSGLPCLIQGIFLTQGSPTLQADSLPSDPPGKPKNRVGSLSLLKEILSCYITLLPSVPLLLHPNTSHMTLGKASETQLLYP